MTAPETLSEAITADSADGAVCTSSRGRVVAVRNTLILMVSHVAKGLGNFAVSFSVANVLGEAGMGVYSFSTSASEVLFSGAELGVSDHLKRTIARSPEHSEVLVQSFLLARLLLIPLVVVAVGAYGWATGFSGEMLSVMAISLGLGLGFVWMIYEALFVAREDIPGAFLGKVPFCALLLAAVGCWWYLRGGLMHLALAAATIALAQLLFAAWLGRRRAAVGAGLRWAPGLVWQEVKRAWVIGLCILLAVATTRAPVLIISTATQDAQMVGRFAGILMMVNATSILQMSVSNVAFPKMARSYQTDPGAFRRAVIASNGVLALLGILFALAITFDGGRLVTWAFGWQQFSGAGRLAAVLGWSCPLLLLAHHNILVLAAAQRENVHALLMAVGLVVTAAAVALLLPFNGLVGAAWGVLIGRGVVLLGLAVVLARLISKPAPNTSVRHKPD